jgi:hypothetical protein
MPGNGVREISIQPDLRIVSTSSGAPSGFGLPVSDSYRVTNAGPFDATNVRTRIQLPAGATDIVASSAVGTCTVAGTIVTCIAPILRTNANATITIAARHPGSGYFSVVATVEGDQPDAATADNSVTSNITVAELSDLSVTLTGSAILSRGEAANLSLRVTNAGPNDSSVASVTLELAGGFNVATVTPSAGTSTCVTTANRLACQLPQLAVGASVTIAIATSASTASGSFTHMATVEASGTDQRGSNNVASAVTTVSDVAQNIGNSGGGGGGSISLFLLAALLLLSHLRTKTRVL